MNNKIKIICYGYRPGTAWTNRYIAYAKAFAKLGRKVVFIFLIPDKYCSKLHFDVPGIDCIYLWDDDGLICRHSKLLSYIKNRFRIKKFINDGDICFFSDASGLFVNEVNRSRKKIKTIFESTEHPEVLIKRFGKRIRLSSFYKKLKLVDNILVISQSLKDFYVSKGFSDCYISVVNMFVDITRFDNLYKYTDKKYIAYCGSVSCEKDGVDLLIQSFSKFKINHPNYYLEIYGNGPKHTMANLKDLSSKLGVSSNVSFVGIIPYEQMPNKLYNASILALSRPDNIQNKYGFPTKLGEYLATGNPVVATSVGEISNFIVDGENGYLAEPGNVDSFAQKLLDAERDLNAGKNVGIRGRSLVESEFSSNVQVQLIASVFTF